MRRPRRASRLGVALALLLGPGLAAAPLVEAAAQAPRGREAAAPRGGLAIPLGEGRLVRYGEPAAQVLVGDSAVADVEVVSPTAVFVYGRAVGRTNLIAVGADGRTISEIPLQIVRNVAAGREAAARTGPRSGVIAVEPLETRPLVRGQRLDVQGALDAAAAAREAAPDAPPVDRTRLGISSQVSLRVRFAEVARNDVQRLGVNWNVLLNPGNFLFGFVTGRPLGGFGPGEAFGVLSGGFLDGRNRAEALLDLLQREGLLTLLAEPNLTTVSGQPASFLAGGELPIPVPQGDRITTVAFKPFGVSLAFTPTLLPGERIGLRVRPEVSTLSPRAGTSVNGFFVPGLVVRRAETTVELASGQTLAIAGLFQRNQANDLDAVQGLADLPILGPLFQSRRWQREETELVILITPVIVRPAAAPQPATPLDRVAAAAAPRPTGAGFILD